MGKLAVIGVGYWGKNVLKQFCDLLGEERVIACDADAKRLNEFRALHPKISLVPDFATVLNDKHVEAVVIATPASTHFRLARQALLAEKHTLVEKPITLRSSEAQELIALAEHHRRLLMVDHLLQYHPAVAKLKTLILHGELGRILYFHGQRLNLGIVRTEENALWSLGPHDISIILYLLEREPRRVWAHGAAYLQKEIEDVVCVVLEFNDGVKAYLQLSWLDPQKVRKLVVVGDRKMALFDDTATPKLVVLDKSITRSSNGFFPIDRGTQVVPIESVEPLEAICRDFMRCIERGERPRSDGRDGLRVLRVLEAAQYSLAHHGTPVALPEVA
jgi:predicted dehydrogenase